MLWIALPTPAYAHRPHDVVPQVILSPTYGQDSTVYILVRNNLLRSQDGGETWFRLNHGLDADTVLTSVTVAPGSQPVLYATTLEDSLYRSQDGGDRWETVNTGLEDQTLLWVKASPETAQLAFTQTNDGQLYRTATGGGQWSVALAEVSGTALAFSQNDTVLYLGDAQGGFWRSEDEGQTWQNTTQLPEVGAIGAIAIAPATDSSPVIYVGTDQDGVYLSSDNGQTFVSHSAGLSDRRIQDLLISPDGTLMASTWEGGFWQWDAAQAQWLQSDQGLTRDQMADDTEVPHFEDLAVSPTYVSDSVLFLGGFDGLFRSRDQGQSWTELETLSPGTVIALAVSPTFAVDQTLAIATYVGELYISHDAGETWQAINDGLHLPRFTRNFKPLKIKQGDQDPRRFFDIALSSNYAEDNTLFSSILYTKILRSGDGGQSWAIEQLDKEVRGVSLAVSPNFAADKTVFSANQKGLFFRSQDGGKQFKQVGQLDKQPGNDSPSLVVSPSFATDNTLFNTGNQGIYKSTDAGKTWSVLTANTDLETAVGAQIALSPGFADDQTLFVGSREGLYRSQDGGTTWTAVTAVTDGDRPLIDAIALSPNYPTDQTVMVSVRGKGLFKSEDGGTRFTPVGTADLAISRITSVPSAGRALQFSPNYAADGMIFGFGAADTAIYRSTDSGNTWTVLPVSRQPIEAIAPLGGVGKAWLWGQFHRRRLAAAVLALAVAGLAYGLFRRLFRAQKTLTS